MRARWPPLRRSASQPESTRAATQTALPRVRVSPARAGREAAGHGRVDQEGAEAVRRGGGQGGGGADHHQCRGGASAAGPSRPCRAAPIRGYEGERGQRGASGHDERPTPADGECDHRYGGTGEQRRHRDGRLLDPERQALPSGRHTSAERGVAGQLPERVGGGAEREQDEQQVVGPGEGGDGEQGAGGEQDAGSGDRSRSVPLDECAGGHRGQCADPEVDGDGEAETGRGEAEFAAHLDGQAADEEDRHHAGDGGGGGTEGGPYGVGGRDGAGGVRLNVDHFRRSYASRTDELNVSVAARAVAVDLASSIRTGISQPADFSYGVSPSGGGGCARPSGGTFGPDP